MNKIQALVLGIVIFVVGGFLLINAHRNYYNVYDKKNVAIDEVRKVSCFIEKGDFVAVYIISNPNWTDPEGEGAIYEPGDDGGKELYATLSAMNPQGNSTRFTITYRLVETRMTLGLWDVTLWDVNEGALNVTRAFDPKTGAYLFKGQTYIALGEALSTGNYTFSFSGPTAIGAGARTSPPSRFEVWTGKVEHVYPYLLYLQPTAIFLMIVGLAVPIVAALKERKRGFLSKGRAHLPKKAIKNKS